MTLTSLIEHMGRLARSGSFRRSSAAKACACIGLAMTVSAAWSSVATPPASLGRPTTYTIGKTPWELTAGDVTGDGKAELVIAADGAVSVLVNRGDGTFQARRDYARGPSHDSVAIGDLSRDGKPDLVVANGGVNTISVLIGNGDGSFQPGSNYAGGSEPVSVAVADLNGDGNLDVATANEGSTGRAAVAIFIGRGDGSLQARREIVTGTSPAQIAASDVNGDNKPDLVIYNERSGASGVNTVSVFTNGGNGSFARRNYRTGITPRAFAIGDLNGDGKPDIAVATERANAISVLENSGDGTFRPKREFATGPLPTSIAIGDLNGDGRPDLAVTSGSAYDPTTLYVHAGKGDGRFEPRLEYGPGKTSHTVAIDDLNADNKPDIAVSTHNARTVSVLINRPGLCTVQDAERLTVPAAKRLIARASCQIGKTRRVYSNGPEWRRVKRGLVMRQTPKPGTVLTNGGKVNLVVSLGPKQ